MAFDLAQYLKEKPVIALVGATSNSQKYGNHILKDLSVKGFQILPINNRATEIEGKKAFPDLKTAILENPAIGLVVYVVPPKYTLEALKMAASLNLKKAWIQPGAGDETVRDFLEANQFDFLMDACVMVMS